MTRYVLHQKYPYYEHMVGEFGMYFPIGQIEIKTYWGLMKGPQTLTHAQSIETTLKYIRVV